MEIKHHTMLALLALAALSASPAWAEDSALEVQRQGDISYVSGGIGKDESDTLQAAQHNYNLRITNADKTGHFSGNTRITISDLNHTMLLDVTGGPLFYANLPKGRYIVEGYANEQTKKQVITIATGKPVRVRFVWPEDMSDTINY